MNTITKTIAITDELIEDLLCTAFEGGSTYWAENISCEDIEDMHKVGGYKSEYLTKTKKDNAVMYIHAEDDKHPITKKSIIDALQKMDNPKYKCTKALSRIINGQYDGGDADIVLQTACFGQVIYG